MIKIDDSFNISIEIIKNNLYECKKCGEVIRMRYNASTKSIKKCVLSHLKTCNCNHIFTEWHTVNLGTWPDNEPCTSRRCSICNIVEFL